IHQLAETQAITRHTTSGTWVAKEHRPHRRASLRTYEPAVMVVHALDGRLLSRWAPEWAFRDGFEGAVYPDEHGTCRAGRVIAEPRRVSVPPAQADYVTRGRVRTTVTERSIAASVARDAWRLTYGPCVYTETLAAYERLNPHTGACRSVHILPQRQRQFATQGLWLSGTKALESEPYPLQVAWHTLVHAVLAGLPLLLLSDANALRGGIYKDAVGVEAVFSDAQAGGNGTCAFLYQAHERLLRVALQILL